jgi:signal transduction histidine kinase
MTVWTRVTAAAAGCLVLIVIGSGQYLFEEIHRGAELDVAPALHGATLYFMAWLPLVWPLQRVASYRWIWRQQKVSALLVVGFTIISFAVVQILCRRALSVASGWEPQRTLGELATSHLYLNVVVAAVVVAIAHSVAGWRHARERDDEARRVETEHAKTEARLARSELHRLQQQLQPHFLFNALNAISELMHHDVDAADRALDALSALLRDAVGAAALERWPLHRERAVLERYTFIQQLRFGARLRVHIVVADAVADAAVPPFLLQPVVENAIEHAAAKRQDESRIEIRCRPDRDSLRIEIADDGAATEPPRRPGTGVGMSLTRTRLSLLYGSRASLELQQEQTPGTKAVIVLPLERS